MRPARGMLVIAVVCAAAGAAIGAGITITLGDGDGDGAVPAATATRQPATLAADVRKLHSDPSYLFSQDAAGGTLRGPDDQHLVLTLTGIRDWVTRFTDRPARAAQTVDIRDFLSRWNARFASSPPNAILSFQASGAHVMRDMVLEIRDPRYDASRDTIRYEARRMKRTPDRMPGTVHPRRAVVYPLPRVFGTASLFIDDTPNVSCGYSAGQIACAGPLWDPNILVFGTATAPFSYYAADGSRLTVESGAQVAVTPPAVYAGIVCYPVGSDSPVDCGSVMTLSGLVAPTGMTGATGDTGPSSTTGPTGSG